MTNLIHCDYPRFEVVVVNDGSSDETLERLKRAFKLRRTDLPYREAIGDRAGAGDVRGHRPAAARACSGWW